MNQRQAGKKRFYQRRINPPGTTPGTLIADPNALTTKIRVMGYNKTKVITQEITSL